MGELDCPLCKARSVVGAGPVHGMASAAGWLGSFDIQVLDAMVVKPATCSDHALECRNIVDQLEGHGEELIGHILNRPLRRGEVEVYIRC